MYEKFIAYVSRRPKVLSITMAIVGIIGVAYFSFSAVTKQELFGTPVGVFEFALLAIFFSVLLIVLEIEQRLQKRKDMRKKFFLYLPQIKGYHTELKHCPEGAEGYEELQDRLLDFKARLLRFAIDTPSVPMHFDDSEWKESKEQWRKFLENLYSACQARDLKAARRASSVSSGFFPTARN